MLDPAGQRPAAGPAPGVGRRQLHGTIQLTNPRLDRNLEDKVRPEDALARRSLGHRAAPAARRLGLEERVEVTNYAEDRGRDRARPASSTADAADIFEVRGWVRPARGRHLPIAMRPDRVDLPLRRPRRRAARDAPCCSASRATRQISVDPDVAGSANAGWVRLAWHWELAPGPRPASCAGLAWTTERDAPEPTDGGSPVAQGRAGRHRSGRRAVPEARRRSMRKPWSPASYPGAEQGFAEDPHRQRAVQPRDPSDPPGDLRLLINDGPGPDERYIAAGVPWFTTLFGGTRCLTSFQALAVRPQLAIETLETLARVPGRCRGPGTRRIAGQEHPRRAAHRRTPTQWRPAVPDSATARGGRTARRRAPLLGQRSMYWRPRPRRPAVAERAAPRWSGSTATATATGTGSWSTRP